MAVITEKLSMETRGDTDIIEITGEVADAVIRSGLGSGTVTVFIPGATGGVTTVEYEPGLEADLKRMFEELAPEDRPYSHNERWGDGNGHSHVRASLLGPSLSVPFFEGRLLLGTWQQIIVIDFDNRPRKREVIVQVVGETI